jgi:hypothetical protein
VTPFEAESVAIARDQFWASVGGDFIAAGALFAAIIGGFLAYKNIQIIIEQLRLSRWSTLLLFEQDMANRREAFHKLSADIAAKPDISEISGELLRARFGDAKENYFNSLERLASSILNGHFPDAEMKQDYQEVFTTVVREFPEDFETGTRYRKVVKLFNRWQDES